MMGSIGIKSSFLTFDDEPEVKPRRFMIKNRKLFHKLIDFDEAMGYIKKLKIYEKMVE